MRALVLLALATTSLAFAVLGACTGDDPAFVSSPPDAGPESSIPDVQPPSVDAGQRCRAEDAFGTPNLLYGVNRGSGSIHPRLTDDELELIFQDNRSPTPLIISTRDDIKAPFDMSRVLDAAIPDAGTARSPSITGDGLVVYVTVRNRLAKMVRTTRTSPFAEPELIGLDDPDADESDPHILHDGNVLYFSRAAPDGGRRVIHRATRQADGRFATAEPIDFPAFSAHNVSVSHDDVELYFTDLLTRQLHRSLRAKPTDPWGAPVVVPELDVGDGGEDPRAAWLSRDGCRLYMVAGVYSQAYLAERVPR